MPSARKASTRVIVRPTASRRGAHSARGRPISVRTIGGDDQQAAEARRSTTSPRSKAACQPGRRPLRRRVPAPTGWARRRCSLRNRPGTRATSRGIGQGQRLAHEAADQRRAESGLQGGRDADRQRQRQGRRAVIAERRAQREIGGERAEPHAGQHASAIHQDAGEGDAGGRIERRGVARCARRARRRPTRRRRRRAPSARAPPTPARLLRRDGAAGGSAERGMGGRPARSR